MWKHSSSPLPSGERSDRACAIRVRGPFRESEPVARAPHPDPLPARATQERGEGKESNAAFASDSISPEFALSRRTTEGRAMARLRYVTCAEIERRRPAPAPYNYIRVARNFVRAPRNSSGRSRCETCPAPAISTSCPSGSSLMAARPSAGQSPSALISSGLA